VLLIDELARHGCRVEFLDRPMSQDPHDQLLLQIRGAVAEYERTLIAERMRRGRQARLRAGTLLPWTRAPFGYRVDPQRPGEVAGVRVEPDEAVLVAQLFDWYLEPGATLYRLAKRLTDLGVATPTGKPRWNVASVRGMLRNPAYAGRAQTNRTRVAPARQRKSALLPVGPGQSHAPRPPQEWITVAVPQLVSEETFAQVQAKLDTNQQGAARNTRHPYLLRSLVSCGACRLSCTARTTQNGYNYYICVGRTDALRRAQGQRCTARYAPAEQLDELVWADLSALLADPVQVAAALARARGGAWLPQELQARQRTIGQAVAQLQRQQQRLLDAYLAEVVTLAEFERKRGELERRRTTLADQQRQLDVIAQQRLELGAVADGIERFCQTVRDGLATATFAQRRLLVELLIDRVVVTDGEVEIRYVLPIAPEGPHPRFCQLRKDHLDRPAGGVALHQRGWAGLEISGDQRQVVAVGRAGGSDRHHLHGAGPARAVPQATPAGHLHRLALAVAGHDRLLEAHAGQRGEHDQLRQALALGAGSAGLAGRRWRQLVQCSVSAQPGRELNLLGEVPQGLAGVGGVTGQVDLAVGVALGDQGDQLDRQVQLGPVGLLGTPQAAHDRQTHRPLRHKRQPHQHHQAERIRRPARRRKQPVRATVMPHPHQPGAGQHAGDRPRPGWAQNPATRQVKVVKVGVVSSIGHRRRVSRASSVRPRARSRPGCAPPPRGGRRGR
jgi:site-specific DNA recombinase